MITIQLEKGTLDIPSGVEISLTHTPYRFAQTMQDEWTNDFTVPATRHNIRILDCHGLLYANNQRYGSEIKPCTLTINGVMKDARVQVVSMTKDDIQLCLYVAEIPLLLKGKTIRDLFQDNADTITPWMARSASDSPSLFPEYDYGMPYNTLCAQRHPAKPLNYILRQIQYATGVVIEHTHKNYYALAQHRYVCPQNPYQVITGILNDDGTIQFSGGQHICNETGSGADNAINFRKDCSMNVKIYTSYSSQKQWNEISANIHLKVYGSDGSVKYHRIYTLPTAKWVNHTVRNDYEITLNEGDYIVMSADHSNLYDKGFKIMMFCEYSDYTINEDDYGIDLNTYKPQQCQINPYEPTGNENVGEATRTVGPDGKTWLYQTYQYRQKNGVQMWYGRVDYPLYYWAYFGYWANVDNVKITDLLYNIAFLEGKEATWDSFRNEITYQEGNRYKVLDNAQITQYTPTSSLFAQKNYITWKSEENSNPISEIDSVYLEDEKTLKESIFSINKQYSVKNVPSATILQYSNEEYDEETGQYTCDFEELEGFCLLLGTEHNGHTYLHPITLNTNGLEKITSVMEVKMLDRLGTDLSKTDYVYVNGVKIMLTNVNSTLNPNSNENEITGIIVPEQF